MTDCWILTPADLFAVFIPVKSSATNAHGANKPFAGAKRPLDGTPFQYQVALSDKSLSEDVKLLRRERPTLPLSGDRRAGIILFDGSKIIASYIIPGNLVRQERQLFVHADYRRRGLASRMIEQWMRETPTARNITRQPLNVVAARAFLAAHRALIIWAVAQGKNVPQSVADAVTAGNEANAILARFAAVDAPAEKA